MVGNALCVVGNAAWVYTLHGFPGNEKWEAVFFILIFVNIYGTKVHWYKVKNVPPGYWDSDDEVDEEETKTIDDGDTGNKSKKKWYLKKGI